MPTRRQPRKRSTRVRSRSEQVRVLEHRVRELDDENAQLRAENAELRDEVAALTQREAELKAKLSENSQNSSRPPSSDPPGVSKPVRKRKGGRRRGAQPGHKGVARKLLPLEQVDDIKDHKPSQCRRCGEGLDGEDPSPTRHQITDIPPITPSTVEHRLHRLSCDRCGAETRAELPSDVPQGAFGPRLQALVAVLSGCYRLSKRNIEQMLSDCFGVVLSLGSVKALENAASGALAKRVEEAREHVKTQAQVNLDETGWRCENKRAWLWTAVAGTVAVFLIRCSRGARVAKELVGELYHGIASTDRYSGYTWLPLRQRQICWAHLKRDFQKIADMGGSAAAIGYELSACRKKLFKLWWRVRDGTLKRSSFRTYVSPIRQEIGRLLRQGTACDVSKASGMCKKILTVEMALWTFVRVPGIDPTNNAAERSLRHAVIWRKTSFGTQSETGRVFVERMLTVVTTLRLQGRSVLEYVATACAAALEGREAPPLLQPSAESTSAAPTSTMATAA